MFRPKVNDGTLFEGLLSPETDIDLKNPSLREKGTGVGGDREYSLDG